MQKLSIDVICGPVTRIRIIDTVLHRVTAAEKIKRARVVRSSISLRHDEILLIFSLLLCAKLLALVSLTVGLLENDFNHLSDFTSLFMQVADKTWKMLLTNLGIISPVTTSEKVFELLPGCQLL